MSRDLWFFGEESREEANAGGAVLLLLTRRGRGRGITPVSGERKRGKKGEAATRDCNMVAVVYLRHTAVIPGEEVVLTPMWDRVGVTQPLSSSSQRGDLRRIKASYCSDS